MAKYPIKLNPSPIVEAVFEIRFESSLPGDAIFGIIYNLFKDEYKSIEKLPILQLPPALREQDPNLLYNPLYKITNGQFIIQIGPKVFSLSTVPEYCGWTVFGKKIQDVYSKLQSLNIIQVIKRISLRYINAFPETNIYPRSNITIKLNDFSLAENPINLTTQIHFEYGLSVLRIINDASITIRSLNGKTIKGSLVDIDTCVFPEKDKISFEETIDTLHKKSKELFFQIVNSTFIEEKFKPIYEVKK